MGLAMDIAQMAKGGFSHSAIEETQYLIKNPRAKVREEKKQGVRVPGHPMVKPAIERHLAILHQHHTARCLSCQNGTAKNLHIRWWNKGTGAALPNWPRQLTPEPTPEPTPELTPEPTTEPGPPLPGTPPAPTNNTSGAQRAQIINLPAGYEYSHGLRPCADSFTVDASAQHSQHDIDFDPDMLTYKRTSTG